MSARKIPKNYRNVTGVAASKKVNGQAAFESTLERDFLTLLEFSPEVESFEVQPIVIEWIDDAGKTRRYHPDVFVRYNKSCGQKPHLFEVKYRSDLAENWGVLKYKFRKAWAFSRQKNWRFKIVTEVEIRTPFLDNARFLLPFTRQGVEVEKHLDTLKSKMQELGEATPQVLLARITDNQWVQAEMLPSLWYLVGGFQIGCDLEKPLNMNSTIWSSL
jgi:hypothetical protein